MGKVVKLEKGGAASRRARRRRSRRPRSCSAAAASPAASTRSARCARSTCCRSTARVNQFDVYVGTSAGSLVAALAANGVTPEQMMRVVNDQVPTPFRDINLDMLLRPNYREFAAKGAPAAAAPARRRARRSAAASARSRTVDLAIALADALPSGLYTGLGDRGLRAHGALRPRPHRRLPPARRTSSTSPPPTSTPASGSCSAPRAGTTCRSRTAVRASTALPMVYKPRRGQGPRAGRRRHRLDHQPRHRGRGGREVHRRRQPARARSSTTSRSEIPTLFGTRVRRVSDMGFPKIAYQTFKLLAYQRLHEMARQWEERYPGVDIVLIEPEPDDELMFQTNILNYSSRRRGRPPRLPVGHASSSPRTTTSCARSASATASRSRPRACARSSSTSPPRRRRPAPGAGSSSRRPARCCGSPPAD